MFEFLKNLFRRGTAGPPDGYQSLRTAVAGQKRAEAGLKQIEERFRLLVEGVRDYAIFMLDPEGRVATWNAGAQRIIGYNAQEIIGEDFSRFYPPEAVKDGWPAEELKRATAEGRFEDEGWRLRKDGSRFWANVVITALRDDSAKLQGFAKVTRDMTDRKEAEDNARRLLQEEAARRAAEASEARKTAVLDTALDAIIMIDQKGKVIEFNPAAEKTFGYKRSQVLGQSMAELIIPSPMREKHYHGVAHYLATGEGPILNQRLEMPALRADGTQFFVEMTVASLSIGGPPIFTAYLRDITERKRRDQRRAARLAITQILAEASSLQQATPRILQAVCESLEWDVGALWRIDLDASVLRCFDLWHRSTVRIPEFEASTRERTFSLGIGLPGRVWSSGQSAWIPDSVSDTNFPRAAIAAREGLHGAFAFPILLGPEFLGVIEFFSRQIREPDPDLLEMVATIGGQIGQFMERKRTELALRDSEQRFARFMQQLPGLAWIKDLQGRYVYANDAAMKVFGCSRTELYGKTDDEVFPPATAAQFKENDRRALDSGAGVQVIETLKHEDGILHQSVVSKFPIVGPDGKAALVGGMAVDVTDRLKAEEALKEADRRKDDFLAMLAHELRNPLAPIRNALHIMRMPGADGEAVERARQMTERQVRHMIRLVDDLLDVGRIMRGKIELRKERVELTTIISHAVEIAQATLDLQGQELILSLPSEPAWLDADPTRLTQILGNLLDNAAKFSKSSGRVWLTAEREGDEAVLRVRDEGTGIPAEVLPRIFDLFTQEDRSLERSRGGLGIGLTVVQKLVELHAGAVTAHSAGPGMGSEFTVRLPALREASRPTQEETAPEPAETSPGRRVLVVDDNVDGAESIAMLLRLWGHEVRLAHNGRDALQVADQFQPEFVVLDIGLPGMNGYEVARHLRQQPREMLLVAMTGYGQDNDRRRSEEAGFDHHLTKPVDLDQLQTLLSRLPK